MKNSIKSILSRQKQKLISYYKTKNVNSNNILFDATKMDIVENDKNKVWAFCSGQFSNDFRGNPKFLFIYINKFRKDITAYWLCESYDTVKFVRKLGYKAYKIGTKQAEEAIDLTGVLVTEQVKEYIPEGLENCKYVNLWHGVGGVKNVERSIEDGRLVESMAKKYIKNNAFFRRNELYLAPSKFIEGIAIDQLGIHPNNIIRSGYPRCNYKKIDKDFSSFPNDFIEIRGLPSDTKIITYVPTYRNEKKGDFFTKAIPNIDDLIKICEKKHYLLIFKMHPLLEDEVGFIQAKEKYKDNKWIMFWNNFYDFYEVMDKIDLCIYDFSSIYTDFVAFGTKNYIRYVFDFDELNLDFPMGYDETTLGKKCFSFEELLVALENYEEDLSKDIKEVKDLYWEYSNENDFDNLIQFVLDFTPNDQEIKNLYSYDIFDTLISRKVLSPMGIHYYVKEKIEKGNYGFSDYFINNYPTLRRGAELNMREYYTRTTIDRDSLKVEIQFSEIFDRLKSVYQLNDKQVKILMDLEMEAELENVIPLSSRIDEVKRLINNGEKVILISDMYLPKEFIHKMLVKADPVLGKLDLYLSSEYGYQKADKTLFIEVYKTYGRKYNFNKWIHTGDNIKSDNIMPRKLFIETNHVVPLEFNEYENDIINSIQTYDSYLIAGMLARFRESHQTIKEQFIYSYISFLFVPYVKWALEHAKADKDDIVYFISRDGHQLIRIGEIINEKMKLGLDLKYIYASRKTWRIPSFIDHIDVDFWGEGHGNFTNVTSFKNLLKALNLDRDKFVELFPELLSYESLPKLTNKDIVNMVKVFSSSKAYEEYLLRKAKEERVSVSGYLKQEIDAKKQFSFVEYWGRGYTQENFTRLWDDIVGKDVPSKFYYSRSTLPSDGLNIRYNYIVNPEQQQFIESIFACIDYKSITKYEKVDNKWKPIIEKQPCDFELFKGMEKYLSVFTKEYCDLPFLDFDRIGRNLIDFAVSYYTKKPTWKGFTEVLGKLRDSVQLYADQVEFAPPFSLKDVSDIRFNRVKIKKLSGNPAISLERSSEKVKNKMFDLYLADDIYDIDFTKKYHRSEIDFNKRCKKQYEEYKEKAYLFGVQYKNQCDNKLEDKILIFKDGNNFDIHYSSLLNELNRQDKYIVDYSDINDSRLAFKLATSKYILLSRPCYLFNELNLRKESKMILMPYNAIHYFSKGLITNSNLYYENKLYQYIYHTKFSLIQIPSMDCLSDFNSTYSNLANVEYLKNGSVVTDLYFSDKAKKRAREHVYSVFGSARGKKIIAYITFERYRNEKSQFIKTANFLELKKNLESDYVVLFIRLNNRNVSYIGNKFNYGNFSKDVTDKISVRELLLSSDLVVSDYGDIVLESPLLGVPVFNLLFPSDVVESNYDTLIKLSKEPYGKVVTSTKELIDGILDISNFDYSNQEYFKDKYLSYCNGNSAIEFIHYINNK